MKTRLIPGRVLFVAIALLATACSPAAPAEEATAEPTGEGFSVLATDALGNEIVLVEKPQRIISLTLGTDELLLDLVGPERLLGVTYLAGDETTSNIANDPALAQVENTVEADPEQIIALEPDLVFVATFTGAAVMEQLTSAGLNVYAVGFFNSIEAMQANILEIGRIVGEEARAQELIDDMNNQLTDVETTVSEAGVESPAVLYLASGGWVAGSATTVDDIITRAGGTNIAAEAGLVDWNQVNEEAILEMNPDVVLLSPYVTAEEFQDNPVYAGVNAVANGRVYPITDACMSATSQYIVCGVEETARALYPDLFPTE